MKWARKERWKKFPIQSAWTLQYCKWLAVNINYGYLQRLHCIHELTAQTIFGSLRTICYIVLFDANSHCFSSQFLRSKMLAFCTQDMLHIWISFFHRFPILRSFLTIVSLVIISWFYSVVNIWRAHNTYGKCWMLYISMNMHMYSCMCILYEILNNLNNAVSHECQGWSGR